MEIVRLDPRQKKRAALVLSAGFFDYPMFIFYFPDPKRRARFLPWYLENVLNCALQYGEVYTTPDISGVIFTLPPGHTRITKGEYVQNGFSLTPLYLGLRNFMRSQECETFMDSIHEKIMQGRPHYYLWGLAVDPNQKQRGIGSALLKPVIEKADLEGKQIYLETHLEYNVAYYQRTGFQLACNCNIPKYGIPIWCMVREPN